MTDDVQENREETEAPDEESSVEETVESSVEQTEESPAEQAAASSQEETSAETSAETTDETADTPPPEDTPPEPLPVRAERELAALKAVLRKTRREVRAPVLFEGLAWFFATLGAVIVSAQFGGLLFGDLGVTVMQGMLAVGFGAAALGGLLALVGFVRGMPSLEEVGRTLQRHVPDFRSDIVAALQFGEELTDEAAGRDCGWSPELAFAHLKRTARDLLERSDGNGALDGMLPNRSLTPALVAIGGCLALLLAPYPFAGERIQELWGGAIFGVGQDKGDEPENRPIVGDIDLLYNYPPYADMQPRFEPFTTGHIETLIGSEVTIKTYPLVQASKYEIVMQTAEGERVVPLSLTRNLLQGTMLLTKGGTYMFRATLADGTIVQDGIKRSVTLEPDQSPGIVVKSHSGEIEVSPNEILDIEFSVEDDFGIETVSWATKFGEEEPRVHPMDLPELSSIPGNLEAGFELDLRELNLQPKDTVQVWVQATDNNSLTGPGTGRSEPLVLRVASPEDRHMKVIAAEMAVLEQLLEVLGDFLENPVGTRSPDSKGYYDQSVPDGLSGDEMTRRYTAVAEAQKTQATVLAEMATVVQQMKEDPLMAPRDVTIFESLYAQLYGIDRDGAEVLNQLAQDARLGTLRRPAMQRVADWAARTEDALEKGLVRLDNLLASQKMESVKRTAQEIRDLKERLKELLERYRDEKDPELKKAILREVQRLRQRMMELMARMQSQLKRIPEEHVNMEAIEQAKLESDAQKMGDSLQRIEDMLEQDDIDGALEALDEMTASLDQLTKDMDEQLAGAEPEGLREMDKALSELMDKANDLENRQRELERETRDQQEALSKKEQQRLERMLEQQTAEIERLAREQEERLQKMSDRDLARHDREAVKNATERARKLNEMLQNKDIQQALQQARGLREDLRAIEFSLDLSQRYTDKKTPRGQDVRRSRGDVQELQPRASKIVKQLEDVMDQARSQQAMSSDPRMQQLAQEQKATEQQAQQLREQVGEASQRFPMLEQELAPPLENAQKQMGEATEGLEGQKPQRALDHQRAALEQLRQLKQSMRDALQKQNQKGQRDGRTPRPGEKVVIPEKDGRSRERFREDVMDGMKQERLEDYESEIERYYESLMQ